MAADELRVEIEPGGLDEARVSDLSRLVLQHPRLVELLAGADHRLIGIAPVHEGRRKARGSERDDVFRATIYDYTNDRTLDAVGRIDDPGALRVEESARQPVPSAEELELAVRILSQDQRWGPLVAADGARTMVHVPPVLPVELPDGRLQRRIGVIVMPREPNERFRVAAVDLVRGTVEEHEPRGGDSSDCGPPGAGQSPTTSTPGQAWVSIWQGGTRLWRFLARRPAGSSGTNGSGIELQYVDYRDKRVLYQAHVPILNVRYDGDACGPYLDWQNWESPFEANGVDPVPGFRLCNAPARTILDSGVDAGNFAGVAVYVDGQEVVLISEMEAGWYRYVSSWRFHVNGTIRPRFGFDAVQYPCVCNVHHHHCYWRLDFDIRTPSNVVSEFNEPPLVPAWGNWHDKTYEIQRARDPARGRKWRVADPRSGSAYEIVPGSNDGVATSSPDWPFPQGDLWFVQWKPGAEVDNGVVATGPPYEANIGNFVNGERLQDVVVWYGAHFTHDVSGPHTVHIVGPDLVPVNW